MSQTPRIILPPKHCMHSKSCMQNKRAIKNKHAITSAYQPLFIAHDRLKQVSQNNALPIYASKHSIVVSCEAISICVSSAVNS